jgi:excisionase family DNA binding protein
LDLSVFFLPLIGRFQDRREKIQYIAQKYRICPLPDLMNTHEVAEYLRIKERKVYDLVRQNRIPCTRVTGKWLFPKHLIDLWVARGTAFPGGPAPAVPPPVVAGSHDPLLDWSLRESGCALAMLSGGSLDGLQRLVAGEAVMCGMHVYDPGADGDGYNVAAVRQACAGMEVVLIEWGWRQQGLVLDPARAPVGGSRDPVRGARRARTTGAERNRFGAGGARGAGRRRPRRRRGGAPVPAGFPASAPGTL